MDGDRVTDPRYETTHSRRNRVGLRRSVRILEPGREMILRGEGLPTRPPGPRRQVSQSLDPVRQLVQPQTHVVLPAKHTGDLVFQVILPELLTPLLLPDGVSREQMVPVPIHLRRRHLATMDRRDERLLKQTEAAELLESVTLDPRKL